MTGDIMNFLKGVAPGSPVLFYICGGIGLAKIFIRPTPLLFRITGVFLTGFMENLP